MSDLQLICEFLDRHSVALTVYAVVSMVLVTGVLVNMALDALFNLIGAIACAL